MLPTMRQRYITDVLGVMGARSVLARLGRWSGVLALNYHRIGDGATSVYDRGLWSADPEAFDFQVGYLKSQAEVITPADLPEVLKARRGRHVLVTFDDGYRD